MADYNDRFKFTDPSDKYSMNRTTRYRIEKKRTRRDVGTSMSASDTSSDDNGHIETRLERGMLSAPLCVDVIEPVHLVTNEIELQFDSDTCDVNNSDYIGDDATISADTSDDPDDNEQITSLQESKPLYEGSPLTLSQSNLLINKFKVRHNLSKEGMKDLLLLVQLHCPVPNECLSSVYLFNQHCRKSSVILHYYCKYCLQDVDSDMIVCPNAVCGKDLSLKENKSFFIQVSIVEQIQRLLGRK